MLNSSMRRAAPLFVRAARPRSDGVASGAPRRALALVCGRCGKGGSNRIKHAVLAVGAAAAFGAGAATLPNEASASAQEAAAVGPTAATATTAPTTSPLSFSAPQPLTPPPPSSPSAQWPAAKADLSPPADPAAAAGPVDPTASGVVVMAVYTANDPIEDRHATRRFPSGDLLAAVFDGHGGWQTSEFAQQRMATTVQRELSAAAATTPDEVTAALGRAFLRVEREFLYQSLLQRFEILINGKQQVRSAFELGFGDVARTGACALVALVRHGHLYVANAGDCRAVLGRRHASSSGTRGRADGGSGGGGNGCGAAPGSDDLAAAAAANSVDDSENGDEDGDGLNGGSNGGCGLEAVALSFDHNAKEEREKARLRALHPTEADIVMCKKPTSCYVKGRLQPTRALGDAYLKYSEFNGQPGTHRSRGRYLPPPYTPPYITAEPEVSVHALDPLRDEFVILGSDGLWDYLSNQEAVEVVAAALECGGGRRGGVGEQLVARVLEKAAAKHGMSLDALRGLPLGRTRRNRHDDITAMVVFLREGDGEVAAAATREP
ncbi:unnamed protein product [Phaeothamnion confervicola]